MNRKSSNVINWRVRTKLKLIEYKGGKCKVCGYDKPIPSAYNFHHRDPLKKDFTISGKSWSFERLKQEVEKCDLVCANCHAEIHHTLSNNKRQARIEQNKKNWLTEKKCKLCHINFKPKKHNQQFCSTECSNINRRKVKRPDKDDLQIKMQNLSWCEIARQYGVSDNSVRKWAKHYNLL